MLPRRTRWEMRAMREQMTQNASLIRAAVVLLLSSLWGWLGAGAGAVVVAVAVVVTGSAWAGFAWAEAVTALVGVGAGVFIVVVERLRDPRRPGGAYLSSSVLEYAWGVSNAGVKCAAGSTRAEALEPARVAPASSSPLGGANLRSSSPSLEESMCGSSLLMSRLYHTAVSAW